MWNSGVTFWILAMTRDLRVFVRGRLAHALSRNSFRLSAGRRRICAEGWDDFRLETQLLSNGTQNGRGSLNRPVERLVRDSKYVTLE